MSTIRIGFIADVQVGSMFSPWPVKTELSTGSCPRLNRGQKYLNDYWYDIAEKLPPLDIMILNGDMIDGQQPKSQSRYLCETDPQFQARAALDLLEPYQGKVGVWYCTEGTEYHDGVSGTWTEWLGRELKAVKMGSHYAWDWLLLDIAGLHFDIAHHQSFMIRYRSTALEREMQFSAMLSETADVIVRSHTHEYMLLQTPCDGAIQTAISTPAWQLQTHHARTSRFPNRLLSKRLGMVVVTVEDGEVSVKPYTFPHPPLRRAKYAKAA